MGLKDWKSNDVYVTVLNDVSESVARYFAPVVALIGSAEKAFGLPEDFWISRYDAHRPASHANHGGAE